MEVLEVDIECSRKAQMRIQQMAFMLVALVVFFAMVGLVYFSIYLTGIRGEAEKLGIKEAQEIAKKIAGSSEFAFTAIRSCTNCIDLDRAFVLKSNSNYDEFFGNLNYLMIRKIYPASSSTDCTSGAYPDCSRLILVNRGGNIVAKTAFVTLVRWNPLTSTYKYEFGEIQVSSVNKTQ